MKKVKQTQVEVVKTTLSSKELIAQAIAKLSPEELAAIYDGNLKGVQAAKVRDHIASCPRCAHELHVLHQSMQPVPLAPSPPGDLVARALKPSKKSGITPQVNLLRPRRRPTK